MEKKWLVSFGSLIAFKSSLAYIDPGTGGMIAGSIWPVILGGLTAIGAFFAKYFFQPIKKRAQGTINKMRKREARSGLEK
jgi:hypothetical protein